MPKKPKLFQIILIIFLLGLGIAARFLPHAPNFVPIAAIALFGAVYLPRKLGLTLPLVVMLISDAFIGFYSAPLMTAVYTSFLLTGVLGIVIKKYKKWYTILGGAVGAGILFFIVTNFAVWAFSPWYAKTLKGLLQCFVMALPFFRNTLFSNLFYTLCLFGAYETAINYGFRGFKIKSQISA